MRSGLSRQPLTDSLLPVAAVLDAVSAALADGCAAVLQAPPGAGKTTLVPLALKDDAWLAGRRILVLEPRRLAARLAARRMAGLLGEPVGETVGYRVRLDRQVGPATRIEVLTEGVLTRMLQADLSLEGVGLVVFDEFHERHLTTDLGLALCRDIQGVLNADLRILVMSATLDAGPVSALLDDAPVVECEGRQYPVETRYRPPDPQRSLEACVAGAVTRAAAETGGDMLVFLPGAGEIRRTAALLDDGRLGSGWMVAPLFGGLGRREQDRAIAPAPAGRRKVVLASAVAESSLTIEGIRVVVDCGSMRLPRFDPGSGLTRLVTVPVTRATADQRRGRAGRTRPGVCYRLWSKAAHQGLVARPRAEILNVDLAGLVLDLARWGVTDPGGLTWLDPPPAPAWTEARRLLEALGALTPDGRVSRHGRRMSRLPLHPRLAHMLLRARERGAGWTGCVAAAVLAEGDPLRAEARHWGIDLRHRVDRIGMATDGRRSGGRGVDRRLAVEARMLARRLHVLPETRADRPLGPVVAWAYPDRIARRRQSGQGRYLMANGREAVCDIHDPLASSEWLAVAELDGDRRRARIFLAAGYDAERLADQFGADFEQEEEIFWDSECGAVTARRTVRFGAVAVDRKPLAAPDPERVTAALIDGIRRTGIDCLPWTRRLRRWQQRVGFLRRSMPDEDWPDVSDKALTADLHGWLGPYLAGIRSLPALGRIDLAGALEARLNGRQRSRLDRMAPTHLTVPSGARLPVDYAGEAPVLAARVQQMFGCRQTPAVADGRQPVRLQLLSPAGRPVQVTQDLAGFWRNGYPEVRKTLRGRYPKHFWPEDPLQAAATDRAKAACRHSR